MKKKKNKKGLKPRWEPSYSAYDGDEDEFLGYAGELDVWLNMTTGKGPVIAVVGPDSRKINAHSMHNFDTFNVEDGNLTTREDMNDLHIDVHDMCLIYAVCVENDVFNREHPNDLEKPT